MTNFKLLFTDPTKIGLAVLICIFALIAAIGVALTDESDPNSTTEHEGVEKAIKWLMRDAPKMPMARDAEMQHNLAAAIISASNENNLCPYLVLSFAFLESSFRLNARGKLGERGLMQVHGEASRGCNLTTYRGQADCGARWLRKAINWCGSIKKGTTLYISGNCKAPIDSLRTKRVNKRIELWKRLKRIAMIPDGAAKHSRNWRYRNE